MREKLRLRLTKRKEEQPKREDHQSILERDGGVEDHRRVEDLLQFINSADNKPSSSSKAAKRARHKQKKATPPAKLILLICICVKQKCVFSDTTKCVSVSSAGGEGPTGGRSP